MSSSKGLSAQSRPRHSSGGGRIRAALSILRPFFTLALLALGAFACTQGPSATASQPTLSVAAASDLQFAFAEIARLFEEETGARVVYQFGSSGTLARQIEQGAPVDLFASASEEYVDYLVSKGVALADTRATYALGSLVLAAYAGNAWTPSTLDDLRRPEVRRVSLANPEHAPYGRAAREVLEKAGLWQEISGKVVYGENVRQALQFVQTGNAEAGIIARSIADVPEVVYVPIDSSLYAPLSQTLVIVKGAKQLDLARVFASLLTGERGRSILERYGFALPDGG